MVQRIIVLLSLLGMVATAGARSFEDFKAKLYKTEPWEKALPLIKDYLSKTNNMEEMRELQSIWEQVDAKGCKEYFLALSSKHPKSAQYRYLALRLEDNSEIQMRGAHALCVQHPEFYWGYRLYLMGFLDWLISAAYSEENPLDTAQTQLAILDEGYKRFPNDDYINIVQFHRYRFAGDFAAAETHLLKIKDKNLLLSNWRLIQLYLVDSRNAGLYRQLMPELLSLLIASKDIAAADSLVEYAKGYVTILDKTSSWQAMAEFFALHPQLPDTWEYLDSMLKMLAGTGRWGDLSRELLSGSQKGIIPAYRLRGYLAMWQFDLSRKQEWLELQDLAAKQTESEMPNQ